MSATDRTNVDGHLARDADAMLEALPTASVAVVWEARIVPALVTLPDVRAVQHTTCVFEAVVKLRPMQNTPVDDARCDSS